MMVTVYYPNETKEIDIDIHKPITAQLEAGWLGLVWNGINVGMKQDSDPLGMNSTVDIVELPDVKILAQKRYWEACDDASQAWEAHNTMTDELIAKSDYITINNMLDAAVIADTLQGNAYDDWQALYGDCECGVFGGVCAKCAAYARVMAWYNRQ